MQNVERLVRSAITPAITATALTKRFGVAWAVRDLTFAVPPESVLLVLGPNGSGKTTLLRLLATALRPTSGYAAVFGHDLAQRADAIRTLAAFVGTSPGVYDALTARENLQFAAAMCGRPHEPVAPWLERVGLASAGEQLVHTFSQGMKRRLALARAWLAAPSVLLLDEPYSGLDAEGVQLVHRSVAETTQRGGCVVIATHERDRGVSIADAVLVLSAGRMMEFVPAGQFAARVQAIAGGRR
jgi:heme exporter protein A